MLLSLIYLFGIEVFVACFQMYTESRTFALFAGYLYAAVVQFYDAFGKSQPYTCTCIT